MSTRRSLGLLIAAFASAPLALPGCGTSPEPTSIVCTDFRSGADLSGATFGVTGELAPSFGAFAQAAGDLAAVANEMLHDVGASCQGLAVELGADSADPRTQGKLEPDEVRAWCTIAAERFAKVRPALASAHFTVKIELPKCTTDSGFQVECEQRCLANSTCSEPPADDRCPEDAREGICTGTCTGTCTGSETAPATCAGACEGTCFGTCGAAAAVDDAADSASDGTGGDSAGDDQDACDTGCVCASVCTGTCTGACGTTPGGHCDAICAGKCSEPMIGQTCTKPLDPPTCAGDADCQQSCAASSAARAVCPQGSLSVVIDSASRTDPHLSRIVGALERNLPAIFLASRGRAKVLADGASSVLDSAGHILSRSGDLGPMGAACGILIGQTGAEAKKSLDAALDGSSTVAKAVSGN